MRRNPAPCRCLTPLALALALALGSATAHAGDATDDSDGPATLVAAATFNPSLLAFPVDVSLFAEGNPVPPGDYRVDVYLNNVWKGKYSVRFDTLAPGDRIAQPCFTADMLDMLGINPQHIAADMLAQLDAGQSVCAPLDSLVPQARADYDSGLQRLDVAAPQLVLLRRPRGYVDPRRWDRGVTAARAAYDYNVWHNKQENGTQTSHYLGLRAGVNVGDWRFRYRASATHNKGVGLTYRNTAFFVERALPALRSALLVGEASTRSQVFDSLSFRGIRLESEERMRPDSRNGFAPVVSGIAQSNARVRVAQRGVQIFETTVPPGPFVIDDLYPNGNGGDLLVTITEADGTERQFTVTYAVLPQMLRPGTLRYSVAGGRYRDRTLAHEPFFGMGSVSVGVNNTVTAYGGVLFAQGYDAVSGGVGLNLPVGAITLDGTYARTFLPGDKTLSGTGWRLAYTKRLDETNTDFGLAMLRYAGRNYYEPAQAFQFIDQLRRGDERAGSAAKRRYQFSLNIRQQLPGNWGALSLSGSVQDYWQNQGHDTQYSIGYGRNFGRVSVSINAMRSRNVWSEHWDNQYLLSLSMPLGANSGNPVYLNSSLTRSPTSYSVQNSVSGSFGEQSQYQYGVYASGDRARGQGTRASGGANLAATTSVARVAASVSANPGNNRQLGFHASGGMVLFGGGLVFAPELGETVGIVQAPYAEGVKIPSATGVRVNRRGHAVVPYLSPYRENEVNLDPKGISTDVELFATSQRVAPTHGAVVLLPYPTRRGYAVLTTLARPNGQPVPFAAGVFDAAGNNVGHVAQGKQALLRVDAPQGELTARWGAQPDQQCRFAYDLGDVQHSKQHEGGAHALRRVEATCL